MANVMSTIMIITVPMEKELNQKIKYPEQRVDLYAMNVKLYKIYSIERYHPDNLDQLAIANYLDSEVAKSDALIASVASLIEDLRVYKKALISEVVTGKRREPESSKVNLNYERSTMNNFELFIELLKAVPPTERLGLYNERKNEFGLTEDENKIAFWKSCDLTDEEINNNKNSLKYEAEKSKLESFVADLATRNPEGNLPFGYPGSNIVKIAKLGTLRQQGVEYIEAFIEVFGNLKYSEILENKNQ